jgi:hypothetical protein
MCGEIELCSISLADLQSRLSRKFLSQHANHVAIELDGEDVAIALEQGVGQRTQTRAELDHLVTQRHRCVRDLGYGTWLDQEILGKGSLGEQVVFPKQIPCIGRITLLGGH